MSTEKLATHSIGPLSNLSVIYLRQALNRPNWTTGIGDYVTGGEVLALLPDLTIPDEIVKQNSEEVTLKWGAAFGPTMQISDKHRDIIRKALSSAFADKYLPLNSHSVALITQFSPS